MLPKFIYRLLPYFYIGLGFFCLFFFASPLIFFSSAVFILTGGLVLWMRHNNIDPGGYINAGRSLKDKASAHLQEKGFDFLSNERRFFPKRSFPLLDGDGAMIAFDRRALSRKA